MKGDQCFRAAFMKAFLFAFLAIAHGSFVTANEDLGLSEEELSAYRKLAANVPAIQLTRSYAPDLTYQNWMAELPPHITKMPLTGIAIPGTHDSFTSTLDYHAEMAPSPDLSDTIVTVLNTLGSTAKKVVYNWGVTQSYSIGDQLLAGIRYLDFRVAKRDSKGGDFYLLHSLWGQSIRDAFSEVKNFLDSHKKEVVIIDINHFYNMDYSDHTRLTNEILGTFGSKMVAVRSWSSLNLDNLWNEGKQVVLIYHASVSTYRDTRLWQSYKITSPWPNKNSINDAITYIEARRYPHEPSEGPFWVTQGILTAGAKEIILGIFSSLRSKLGLPMCREMSNWILKQHTGKGGVNIVITDFAEEYGFIGKVIALNYK